MKPRELSLRQLFALWGEDWRAHDRDSSRPGFRALFVYRFGVWKQGIRFSVLRAPFSLLHRFAFRYVRNVYGIELPFSAIVGRGVVIEHQGLLVIHGNTVIGDRCRLRQGTTLGIRSLSELASAPRLGDDVEVGANACILGAVFVGDRAKVGAGAIVLDDVPADSLVVGNPARVVTAKSARKTVSGR